MKQVVRDFVNGMEEMGEKLNNLPMSGKTGYKIGVFLALNPVTAPIATGVTIGGAAVYGLYKVAKFAVEREDRV